MSNLCLVTGANGHLGNNLVRILLKKGRRVRAGVRNTKNTEPFKGLNCEVVYADLMDRQSLSNALDGVDTLYQVAAVFKHWAKDPEKEIIKPNVEGTKNVLEIAAQQGIGRVVYVSSIAALDRTVLPQRPMDENGWNTAITYPYYRAKTVSERLAWELAEKLNLWMVSVLPSAMVGPNCFRLTPTMELLYKILTNRMSRDINFCFNFVAVEDVAEGMIAAEKKGRNGNRYILGNDSAMSTTEIIELARSLYPNIKKPPKISKVVLKIIASLAEFMGKVSGKEPILVRYQVELYYGTKELVDISKARKELGYCPRPPKQAIKEALIYLKNRIE
jgi:dihydroflavonol-4-reductase